MRFWGNEIAFGGGGMKTRFSIVERSISAGHHVLGLEPDPNAPSVAPTPLPDLVCSVEKVRLRLCVDQGGEKGV